MTEKMTTLTTKVSFSEKLGFVELCNKESLSPAVALHSLVVECIERGAIKAVYQEPAISARDTTEERDKATSKKEDNSAYMEKHGITKMK